MEKMKILTVAFMLLFNYLVLCRLFAGGILSNSLALVTDATHMASDLTGFVVSLIAIWMAKKQPSARMSFGFYRTGRSSVLLSCQLY